MRGAQVRLSTGELVAAEYLIGCDGGHSAVRKALGLALHGETLGTEAAFIADVNVEELHHTDWHIWPFAKEGSIRLCPLPHPDPSPFHLMSPPHPLQDTD